MCVSSEIKKAGSKSGFLCFIDVNKIIYLVF